MSRLFIVTGAGGHLGSTIVGMLEEMGKEVRGLILPGEKPPLGSTSKYVYGDVRNLKSLEPLFAETEGREVVLFHTAGIISIGGELSPAMYEVNVHGTKNIARLCLSHKVSKMVYVSSVHAIPEGDHLDILHEVEHFSADTVVGSYAKTKAEATQAVLKAVAEGLNAVVVHPSGILGPCESPGNYLVQMISDYMCGRLPACVRGGYDFVDVRDVAGGCMAAAEKGRVGECYILSGRRYEVSEVLSMVRASMGKGRRLMVLPLWAAAAAAPLLKWSAELRGVRPLYTKYSLYTLKSNSRFSHDKATSQLGYCPRDLRQTICDTVESLGRNAVKTPVALMKRVHA